MANNSRKTPQRSSLLSKKAFHGFGSPVLISSRRASLKRRFQSGSSGFVSTMLARFKRGIAIRFKAGRRRLGRGNLWHDGANRQRRRRRSDRRRVLSSKPPFSARLALFASLGA